MLFSLHWRHSPFKKPAVAMSVALKCYWCPGRRPWALPELAHRGNFPSGLNFAVQINPHGCFFSCCLSDSFVLFGCHGKEWCQSPRGCSPPCQNPSHYITSPGKVPHLQAPKPRIQSKLWEEQGWDGMGQGKQVSHSSLLASAPVGPSYGARGTAAGLPIQPP